MHPPAPYFFKNPRIITACNSSCLIQNICCRHLSLGRAGSGILPAQHLTDSPTLALLLLSTYSPGDVIDGAFCFSDAGGLVFTLRPSLIEHFKASC